MAILSSDAVLTQPDVRTVQLDVSALPPRRVQEESFPIPDLQIGDHVVVIKPTNDPQVYVLGARVTAVDELAIRFWNNGPPTDPAIQDFILLVSRPAS